MNIQTSTQNRYRSTQMKGFTLVEILVTLSILAILVRFALPNYNNFVAKSRLTEATTQLLQISVLQEQFYRDFRGYAAGSSQSGSAPTSPNYTNGNLAWLAPNNAYFTYTIVLGADRYSYTAEANGNTGSVVDKYRYMINGNGIRCMRQDNLTVGLTATATACPTGSTAW